MRRWLLALLLIPCLVSAEEAKPLAENPQAEARLKTLMRTGLPVARYAGLPPLTWENCPFVPGNGYGAIRADHLSTEAAMRLSRAVTHV